MCPDIIDIGPLTVHSYGLCLAVAFALGLWLIWKQSPVEHLDPQRMMTLATILMVAGLVGGRLGFVLIHWLDFIDNPLAAINPFHEDYPGLSGMNLYGGIFMALLAAAIYIRRHRLPGLAIFDLLAPVTALGIGIGRIGCFLTGCCLGKPTDLPWGITFPDGSYADFIYGQQSLHPTQLYSSAYGLFLFIVLFRLLRRKRFDGQITAVFLIAEPVFRSLVEAFRYYEEEMSLSVAGLSLTYNHLAAAVLMIFGVILYWRAPRKLHRAAMDASPDD